MLDGFLLRLNKEDKQRLFDLATVYLYENNDMVAWYQEGYSSVVEVLTSKANEDEEIYFTLVKIGLLLMISDDLDMLYNNKEINKIIEEQLLELFDLGVLY